MRIKKAAALILGLIIIMCASSCGGNDGKTNLTVKTEQETSQAPAAASPVQTQNEEAISRSSALPEYDGTIDVDLTQLNATMVYAEVWNMMAYPEKYEGKVIRARGPIAHYTDGATGITYHNVIIADATACCKQGIEIVWEGHDNAGDYPQEGTEVVVTGVFNTYDESGTRYAQLLCDEVIPL